MKLLFGPANIFVWSLGEADDLGEVGHTSVPCGGSDAARNRKMNNQRGSYSPSVAEVETTGVVTVTEPPQPPLCEEPQQV
jgi:hypothetical protein